MDSNENGEEKGYDPFIFKLVDEGSRQVIESFALPSTCLSVLHQYDFSLSFGEQSKINLECCIWFNPNRESMLRILEKHNKMVIAQIALDEIRGFDEKCRYSVFVEICDIKDSLSKMNADKIKIDFNKPPNSWQSMNHLGNTQKRCWLNFYSKQCIELQSLYLFCDDDVISNNNHQIVIKIYRNSSSDYSLALVGFMTIPIEGDQANNSQQQYNVTLLDPKTRKPMDDQQIDLSLQLFSHQNALEFMRYPTPLNEDSEQYQIV